MKNKHALTTCTVIQYTNLAFLIKCRSLDYINLNDVISYANGLWAKTLHHACMCTYINSGLTCTSGRYCRPGTSTSTITHTSYLSSSTDGVPRVTGVGGHVVGCVWDPSIRQRTQCGAGSCGGWGLVLDIAAMFAAMDMSNMHACILCYLAQIDNSYYKMSMIFSGIYRTCMYTVFSYYPHAMQRKKQQLYRLLVEDKPLHCIISTHTKSVHTQKKHFPADSKEIELQ